MIRKPRVKGEARDAFLAEVCRRYAEGETIRQIAADLDMSYGGIHRMLVAEGVELRPRGGDRRRKPAAGESR